MDNQGITLPIGKAAQAVLPYANMYEKPDAGFGSFLSGILSFILLIAVLLVLFYLLLGGIEWITSGGDKGKTEKARDKMTQSIVGLIVLASTLTILTLVQSFLGVSLLSFSNNNGNLLNILIGPYRGSKNLDVNGGPVYDDKTSGGFGLTRVTGNN